jgi:hypothetical protein
MILQGIELPRPIALHKYEASQKRKWQNFAVIEFT